MWTPNADVRQYANPPVQTATSGELAIHTPDGTWFFLVYERDDSMAAALQPLVDSSTFRKLRHLTLPVATAMGSPWVHGRDKNELIFSQPGEYRVILTEVLETEDLRRLGITDAAQYGKATQEHERVWGTRTYQKVEVSRDPRFRRDVAQVTLRTDWEHDRMRAGFTEERW